MAYLQKHNLSLVPSNLKKIKTSFIEILFDTAEIINFAPLMAS